MCLLSSTLFRNFRLLNLGMMQTKFSIMLGTLAMIAGLSNQLFAQTACFGSDSNTDAPAGFQLSVESYASFDGSSQATLLVWLGSLRIVFTLKQLPNWILFPQYTLTVLVERCL